MAVLPAEIPTGLVTGQYYFVSTDNVDADTDPTLTVVDGTVKIVCSEKVLKMPAKQAVVIPLEFKGKFNSQGQLVAESDSAIGIELPARGSSALVTLRGTSEFYWTITFSLSDVATGKFIDIPSFPFQVSEGQVLDLSEAIPVITGVDTITTQGPTGPAGDMVLIGASANAGANINLGMSDLPSMKRLTLNMNTTVSLPTPTDFRSGTISLRLTQDNIGGRTVTWPPGVLWSDGIKQQPAAAANSVSLFHLMWDGTSWLGMLGGKSFA